MKKVAFLISITIFSFVLCGCEVLILGGAGALVGAGGYHYYQGELKSELNCRFLDAWQASKKAVIEMGYVIEEEKHKQTEGKIKATKLNEEPINIYLKYITSDRTEIGIRIGFFGDKDTSVSVLERIKKRITS
jgi:hypothetical protein